MALDLTNIIMLSPSLFPSELRRLLAISEPSTSLVEHFLFESISILDRLSLSVSSAVSHDILDARYSLRHSPDTLYLQHQSPEPAPNPIPPILPVGTQLSSPDISRQHCDPRSAHLNHGPDA
jgi:hypothetical protein